MHHRKEYDISDDNDNDTHRNKDKDNDKGENADKTHNMLYFQQARKAPSYASSKLRLTHLLTGVKCRATSVAKKKVESKPGRK